MNETAQSDPDRHPVDVVAEQFAERCRRGERPSVSDYANRHPELAEQLREILPPIALMEKLKTRNRSGGRDSAASRPMQIERLGDFRIVREVGRGGMGIVFEARQESLGRHVALKVLSRASLLDPQRVLRFEQEARAAAGLHHTNIVPVFGVGHDDGLHYYAMQFISGRTLCDVIGELSKGEHPGKSNSTRTASSNTQGRASCATAPCASDFAPATSLNAIPPRGKRYWAWVADVGRQVADALHYAHRQGILHRDVKPANLLIDESGNVWITDFGLAKFASLPNNVTQTGDIIGTLQYLAPEALKSETDARGDIYSLGLTLYEMLTLQPAFSEPNPAALLRKIAETAPARPRKINPRIPQDLENVILKAIARDPVHRYQTAAELVEDLDNVVHDRPINARRAYVVERLWRWGRRNRLVASLATAAIVSAIVAMALGWIAYGTARRALIEEADRRNVSELARRQSDANVTLSLRSFEEIFNRLTSTGTQPPPPDARADPKRTQRESQDAAVLKSILSFYDQFAAQNSTNGRLEAEAARAYRRVGDSYFYLWQDSAADTAYRRAAGMFAELSRSNPSTPQYDAAFIEAAIKLGARQLTLEESDAAIVHRGAEVAETLTRKDPANSYYDELAAQIFLREGQRLNKLGDAMNAERRLRASIAAWRLARPQPAGPPNVEFPARMADVRARRPGPAPRPLQCTEAWLELSDILATTHRQPDARGALRESLAECERESRDLPAAERQLTKSTYSRIATAADTLGAVDVAVRARKSRENDDPLRDGPVDDWSPDGGPIGLGPSRGGPPIRDGRGNLPPPGGSRRPPRDRPTDR